VISIFAILMSVVQPVFADPLKNAMFRQRLGNYQFDLATDPSKLVAGVPAKVVMRISGVNGDDVVDVPIKIRLVKDGIDVASAGPIVIPYGHYEYDYTFAGPGKYVLYADLNDYAYSGHTLTFTFVLNVGGPIDYLFVVVPGIGAVAAAGVATIVIRRRRKASA
jgi:hypothetical protein